MSPSSPVPGSPQSPPSRSRPPASVRTGRTRFPRPCWSAPSPESRWSWRWTRRPRTSRCPARSAAAARVTRTCRRSPRSPTGPRTRRSPSDSEFFPFLISSSALTGWKTNDRGWNRQAGGETRRFFIQAPKAPCSESLRRRSFPRDRTPERDFFRENDPVEAGLFKHLGDLLPGKALFQRGAEPVIGVGPHGVEASVLVGLERDQARRQAELAEGRAEPRDRPIDRGRNQFTDKQLQPRR